MEQIRELIKMMKEELGENDTKLILPQVLRITVVLPAAHLFGASKARNRGLQVQQTVEGVQ